MNKVTKFITGLALGVALLFGGLNPAKAQQTLPYVHRYTAHITSATTTTATSADAYIVSIVVTHGTGTGTCIVKNKEGTAKNIFTPLGTASVTSTLTVGNRDSAIYSKGGIDITTSATDTYDVFITYYTL